jgi:hypothetical protein
VLWRRLDAPRLIVDELAPDVGLSLDPEAAVCPDGAAALAAADDSAQTPRSTLASWIYGGAGVALSGCSWRCWGPL